MKLEAHQEDLIVEELLQVVKRVKFDILDGKRREDEYPIPINKAVDLLLSSFERLVAEDAPRFEGSRKARDRSPRALSLRFLKSEKWDHEKVGRKKYKNGPSYSYKFFLPGDEHFVEHPRSRKEFVRLLFTLERRQRPEERIAHESHESPVPSYGEPFESLVRRAYREVVSRSRGATYVRIPELRKVLEVSDQDFQLGLLEMRDQGKVILSKHGFAAGLSREDREASIELSPGEYYYYITLQDES